MGKFYQSIQSYGPSFMTKFCSALYLENLLTNIFAKLNLRGGVSCMPAALLFTFRMLEILRKVWVVAPPSFILMGTVGNVLTLITVTSKHCKKNSFVVYLGALALADTTFLYGAALNGWLFFAYDIDIMLSAVSCKVLGFLLHICKMWSSLSVAALSADRMVCTRFPLKRNTFCCPKSAMIVSGLIFGFAVVMNAHEFYGFKLNSIENTTFCGYVDDT